MKRNQKGFTIVELIIAVAIMSIIALAVGGFMVVGSKSYASANNDINVQQEAQLALNQMSDVLIDTTRSINYVGYQGGSGEAVLKDSELTFEADAKMLTMYNGETYTDPSSGEEMISAGNGNRNYRFYWDKASGNVYYTDVKVTDPGTDCKLSDIPDFPGTDEIDDPDSWAVLAEHVTNFSVDLSQVEEKRVVQLSLDFMCGEREYTTSNNVTVRNKVLINDAEVEPLNRKKSVNIKIKEGTVILEPGESYHFSTPKVWGDNVTDKAVTWSIVNAVSGGTAFVDTTNGILNISMTEQVESFRVKAATNARGEDGKPAEAEATVYVKRVHAVDITKTSDEDPKNGPNEVSAGKKVTLTADVKGVKLGYQCDGCSDSTAKDKNVVKNEYAAYVWKVLEGTELVEKIDTDNHTMDFTVSSKAKKGDTIRIQATSYLSVKKGYTPVSGEITLTVRDSGGKITFSDGLRYGRATKLGIDYPEFNTGGQGYYIVCARIKTQENGNAANDKIMLYGTNGSDAWLTPDLFGLKVNEKHYITLQIIDPGCHFSAGDAIVQKVVNDYLANCDVTGAYNGSYKHTGMEAFEINPAKIVYKYKDELTSGELTLDPLSVAKGEQKIKFGVAEVENIYNGNQYGHISKCVKYDVYKGEGDDKAGWGSPIYGYRPGVNFSDGYSGSYSGSTGVGGLIFSEIQNALEMYIRLDGNNATTEAVGTYHLVPHINYINVQQADHSYSVYYKNYEPNYGELQYYEVPEYTITIKVTNGNITLNGYYDNQFLKQCTGYFPTPSENDFKNMFNLKETAKQQKEWVQVRMYTPARKQFNQVSFKKVTCEYKALEDAYYLSFTYQDNQNNTYSGGTFRCKSDGTEWDTVTVGN